jgi:rhodanese-related sulfurtransferase
MRALAAAWTAAAIIAGLLTYFIMNPRTLGAPEAFTLAGVQAEIETRFSRIDHISAQALSQMDTGALMIFDTRPLDEYAVSHIKDARRIDPDMSVADFTARYGQDAKDKTLVFYCSVGMRSSQLAEALMDDLPRARNIYNLRGGLFGWHNESRPLVNSAGPTRAVHPFDKTWGKLVTDQSTLSYK